MKSEPDSDSMVVFIYDNRKLADRAFYCLFMLPKYKHVLTYRKLFTQFTKEP